MRTPAHRCESCGSANLRLSRRQSKLELLKMCMGTYPFRCVDCNHRFWINIWLFSKLAYAKCPKCLGRNLTNWPRRTYRLSFWKNLFSTFGAHRYRCVGCRYNFLSFRPSEQAITTVSEPEFDLEPETPLSEPDNELEEREMQPDEPETELQEHEHVSDSEK